MAKHVKAQYKPIEHLAMDCCIAPNFITQLQIFSKMKRRFGKREAKRAINAASNTMRMCDPDYVKPDFTTKNERTLANISRATGSPTGRFRSYNIMQKG